LGSLLRPVVNFGLLLMISFEIFRNYALSPRELLTNFRSTVRRLTKHDAETDAAPSRRIDPNVSAYPQHNLTRPI
jgi:hypothetical protein